MGNKGNLSEEKKIDIITPGPWTVESHPDTEGAFIIKEAKREEGDWVSAGYDISDDEGMLREEIMEEHKWGNIRAIEQAPHMFACLLEVAACLRDNKPFRPELVKEIDRSLARVTGQPESKHIPQWIQVLKEKTHQEASKNELVIVMDGGLIQEILSSIDPAELPRVAVVDYDTEGSQNEPVRLENGDKALVWDAVVDRNDKFCRGVCEVIDKINKEDEGKMDLEVPSKTVWERDVIFQMEEQAELTTSDAQGILEAQSFAVAQAWVQRLGAVEAAAHILQASIPKPINHQKTKFSCGPCG